MCKHLLALSVLAAITLITPAQAEEAASRASDAKGRVLHGSALEAWT